jgi:hypothetical protein
MTIEWDPPIDSSPYFVYFYKVELVSTSTELVTPADISATSLRITKFPSFPPLDLSLDWPYTVRVTARNANKGGYGAPATTTVTAYTQPAALSEPPKIVLVSLTSVTLEWPVPTSSGAPSEEFTYKVICHVCLYPGQFLCVKESGLDFLCCVCIQKCPIHTNYAQAFVLYLLSLRLVALAVHFFLGSLAMLLHNILSRSAL